MPRKRSRVAPCSAHAPVSGLRAIDGCFQGGAGRGLANTDVVNDAAKTARVKVEGSLNGQPFVVERTVARC